MDTNQFNLSGPSKPKGVQLTLAGRLAIGVVLAILVVGIYLGVSKISKSADKGGANSTSGSSSTSLVSRFFGSKADVTVCVVTWGGYAGGEYFNGGFKASKDSRYYKDYGMTVEFKVIDQFGPSRDAWKGDECQVLWITADSIVTEIDGLYNHNPRIFFQADNSRGGDVAVANSEIKSVKDLRGKKVAYLPNSPSETLLLNMLDANGMSLQDIVSVETPGAPEAAGTFKSGNADAAMVWSPDDADCLSNVPGSHVLMSSKQQPNAIADVFYAKQAFIDGHMDQLAHLVEGWLIGASEINSDPSAKDKAADILVGGFQGVDKTFALGAINNARLSTYGDNLNFFGLNSAYRGVKGEDLYAKMTRMYTSAGKLSGTHPAWRSIVDLRVLQAVNLKASGAHAAESNFTFNKPTPELATVPEMTSKGLPVTYATGSAVLDSDAKLTIDRGFAHTAKVFGSQRIRIEGNTDDTGNREMNLRLSRARAMSVANYLVSQYGFDPNRFVVVGNGPDNPVCTETTSDCRARNRRTDMQLLNQ